MLDESLRKSYLKEMGISLWQYKKSSKLFNPSAFSEVNPPVTVEESVSEVADSNQSAFDASEAVAEKPMVTVSHDSWEILLKEINSCSKCPLCQSRNMIVPGVGDRKADWLFVGEGPGYYEDQQGEPFVGRSGKLLDNMMAAMSLKRGTNVYIANIVKCRASAAGKDRQPTEEESMACMPFLERQIALINPKIIIALGKTAATALLDISREVSLASLRRTTHAFQCGTRKIPMIITYHPSYLLRTPNGKQKAWEDLCTAMKLFEAINSSPQ